MAAMLSDYKVSYLREEVIAQIALEWRAAGGHQNSVYFNVVNYVESLQRTWRKKGRFTIEFFDAADNDKLAYVEFNPSPTLHVDRQVWKDASLGDPESRFIVAHELGHLVLHDHHAKAFSNDPAQRIKFAEREYSAEWQANTFAYYFLIPDHLVIALWDEDDLMASCGVPRSVVRDRREAVEDSLRRKRAAGICIHCGDFNLNDSGTCTNSTCRR